MAGVIPKRVIEEIRERVSITDVISDYVTLKKEGANYKGLCPFHNEKTASFKVNEGRKMFKCFGCGEGGDVLTFLMKMENMNFYAAAQRLADRAGITLPREEFSPEQEEDEKARGRLFHANEVAARFYHDNLLNSGEARAAREYLESRGFSGETISRYLLGYSPDSWDKTMEALQAKGIPVEHLLGAGLIIERDRGGHYDRFRGRLMFPIQDLQGRVRGFGARTIGDQNGQPKYINSPETKIYKKGSGFYGLYQAKEAIRKKGLVLVVEGYFDQIALDRNETRYCVATLGTALTVDHARMLRRYTREVFLVFDSDEAGRKAAVRSLEPFLEVDINPRIVIIPEGKDPDDYMKSHNAADFDNLLKKSPPLLNYYMDLAITGAGSSPGNVSRAISQIADTLSRIADPIERNAYTERLARRTGAPVSQVRAKVRKPERKRGRQDESAPKPGASPFSEYPRSEVELLRLLIHHPEAAARVSESKVADSFRDRGLAAFVKALLARHEESGKTDPAALLAETGDKALSDLISYVVFESDPYSGRAHQVIEDLIIKVIQEETESRLIQIKKDLEDAQQKGDEGRWRQLMEEQQALQDE